MKKPDMKDISKALNPDFVEPPKVESKALVVAPVSEEDRLLSIIEKVAMSPNIDVTKMQALLDMQERVMGKNAEIAFNQARTRLKFPAIIRGSEIRHDKKLISTYAKYEDIDKIIRPIYEAEGFSISFNTRVVDGKTIVCGKLSHVEGHFETAEMTLPLDTGGAKSAVQAVASTLTYGKRYVVGMLLNIVTVGEDDDGEGTHEFIDTEEAAKIDKELRANNFSVSGFLKRMEAKSVREILAKDKQKAWNTINSKKKEIASEKPKTNGASNASA